MWRRFLLIGILCSVVFLAACAMFGAVEPGSNNGFSGSEKCRACHAQEYVSWQDSWHSKIVRPKQGAMLQEAVDKWASDGSNKGPTVGNVTGQPFAMADVEYVVGSRWKQRYLVKNEATGNLQFMDMQFNRASGKWEKYVQKNDWNTQCATCHTTGYRITEYDDKAGKTLKSDFVELSVGCEACHGPGATHARTLKAKDIFNPADADIQAQSRVCGYCHIRLENQRWKTAQGNPREDFPAPKLGETHKPWDDWTKWYPEVVVIPGLQAKNSFSAEYTGDLKGLFNTDPRARAKGIFEEAKHHQQYQGFIQSKHYQLKAISCNTCHSPHAGKGKLKKVAKDACVVCHDASYTVQKFMPNTGETANNLFVRTHSFAEPPRERGPGASSMGPPNYYGD